MTDEDDSEPVWEEFKLDETNLLTFDRRQQVSRVSNKQGVFFPSFRVQTLTCSQ